MDIQAIAGRAAQLLSEMFADVAESVAAAQLCAAHAAAVCAAIDGGDSVDSDRSSTVALAVAYLAAASIITVEDVPSTVKTGDFSVAGHDAHSRATELRKEAERLLAPMLSCGLLTAVKG